MPSHYEQIRRLISRVRTRWRIVVLLRAIGRAAVAASLVIGLALAIVYVTGFPQGSPLAVAAAGMVAVLLVAVAVVWGVTPLRDVPSNLRVARFIEERVPSLDDRLATAVDFVESERYRRSPLLAEPLVDDAARRAQAVDLDAVVPGAELRRRGMQAAAAVLVLLVLVVAGRTPARQTVDAAALALFPERVRLDVTPGNARVKRDAPFSIQARLAGSRALVAPSVAVAEGERWRDTPMAADGAGAFRLAIPAVSASFKYRVTVGAVTSPTYEVTVAEPPRVNRIDVDYIYPATLGFAARTETDGGDIYAPAGTDVRLHIHAERPVSSGKMVLAEGPPVALSSDSPTVLSAGMKVTADGSYRVTLTDPEGLVDSGQTEYFIRVIEDRPPEVHIVRPASDRSVTRLEEVEIQARADDDYGIERLELVYAIRGEAEKVVPLQIPARATSVTGGHTLYLEDLDVRPGDFVSYYVRARDVARGRRSIEARSDIFFLEVRPFEQEFSLAQSQSMAGSGHSGAIDELVNAQKQIVVATWKLDRRGQGVKGAVSAADVRAIGRSEAELKARVEATASSFRESTMRDPRRRLPGRGGDPSGPGRAGQTMPEEDSMAVAADAMGKAVDALNAIRTTAALPPEMLALNKLLEAQALVKRRQVSRQQSAQGGPGSNNRNYDISTLFDRELQRLQQTNYETRAATESKNDSNASALDKIRELARRQDELLKRQQELERQRLAEDELKRQLESLTREQSELRQMAEDVARQLAREQPDGSPPSRGRTGPTRAGDEAAKLMREAADDMRNAAADLRRRNSGQAAARGSQALEKLQNLDKRLRAGAAPADDARRALGDMQLEARQLADAQRQVASELDRQPGQDQLRRLAGEQQRLADRANRLQDRVKQAPRALAQDVARQRLADRMRKSAEALLRTVQPGGGQKPDTATDARREAAAQQEMARDLDALADRLRSAAQPGDHESRKMSDQLARAQELRERIASLTQALEKLGRQNAPPTGAPSAQKTPGRSGQTDEGRQAGAGGKGEDLARLREQVNRQLQQTRQLLDELRRQDQTMARGGTGLTFEGQGMTFSSPGTEGFKQDFARWQDLSQQATQALEHAESVLSKRIEQKQTGDRLAAGVDDKVPAAYEKQVDQYFKALAGKKR